MSSMKLVDFSKMIDPVWHSNDARQTASVVIDSASDMDLLALSSLEFVVEHNIEDASIIDLDEEKVVLSFSLPFSGKAIISKNHKEDSRLWRETERIGNLYLNSPIDKGDTKNLDLVSLLVLAFLSRENVDSLVLLPKDLREHRIQQYSKILRRDTEEVRTGLIRLDKIVRG